MNAMLERGYNPDNTTASQMLLHRAIAGGLQPDVYRGMGNDTDRPAGRTLKAMVAPNRLEQRPEITFYPASKMPVQGGVGAFADEAAIIRHEREHTLQPRHSIGQHDSGITELGPSIGDLAHLANAFKLQTGRELNDVPLFIPEAGATYNPSLGWMARQASRHGSPTTLMDQLLGTIAGQQWIRQIGQSPQNVSR